jgi:hypothetical protein
MWAGERVRRRPRSATRTGAAVVVFTLTLAACGQEREAAAPTSPAVAPASRASVPGAPARNVLLVTIDTLRTDALGAYRQGLTTSPTIDRLARDGVLFEQLTTSSPSTLSPPIPFSSTTRQSGCRWSSGDPRICRALGQAPIESGSECPWGRPRARLSLVRDRQHQQHRERDSGVSPPRYHLNFGSLHGKIPFPGQWV